MDGHARQHIPRYPTITYGKVGERKAAGFINDGSERAAFFFCASLSPLRTGLSLTLRSPLSDWAPRGVDTSTAERFMWLKLFDSTSVDTSCRYAFVFFIGGVGGNGFILVVVGCITVITSSSPLSPVHTERVDAFRRTSTRVNASNQNNIKDSERTHRTRRVASKLNLFDFWDSRDAFSVNGALIT